METDPTLVESARIHFCGRFDAADRLRLAKTAAGQRQLFHPDRSASVYINECVQRVRPAGKNLSVLPPIEHRQTPEPARGRAYIDGGAPGPIRTGDPLLRRQMLYPTELRALLGGCSDSKASPAVPKIKSSSFSHHCARTVPKPSSTGRFWHSVPVISLARRLSFTNASLFICNFICEYFLNT